MSSTLLKSRIAKAIHEVFDAEQRPLTPREVSERVGRLYPNAWNPVGITKDMIGLTVNHPSGRHYPSLSPQAFLCRLDDGRYRFWNPDTDAPGSVLPAGASVAAPEVPEPVCSRPTDFDPTSGAALSFERDLERCLLSRISQLEPGLRLCTDKSFKYQQLETGAVGRLDLLAIDSEERFVVIELKAGTADDRVCGQVLRYMGWVKTELAAPDQGVRE